MSVPVGFTETAITQSKPTVVKSCEFKNNSQTKFKLSIPRKISLPVCVVWYVVQNYAPSLPHCQATPSFLIKLLTERQTWLPTLGQMDATSDLLSAFDVDKISTTALMFQSGYLTLAGELRIGDKNYYQLRFPNEEVRQSLYGSLLQVWATDHRYGEK